MSSPYDISAGIQPGAVIDSNKNFIGIQLEDGNIVSSHNTSYYIGGGIDAQGNIVDANNEIVPLSATVDRGGDIKWLDTYRSNRHVQTYFNGFVDINGGDLYLREGCDMYLNQGDISLNGILATPEIVLHDNNITSKNTTLNIVPANRFNRNNTGTVRVKGNMTIDGSLNFIGDYILTETNVTVTEQIDISNDGTGPALIARQLGDESVLEFYDDHAKVFEILDGGNTEIHRTLVVHDTSHGNDPSFNSRVGIGTQPEYKLDVHGVGFIRDNMHINTNDTAPSFIPSTKGQLNVGITQVGYVTFDDIAMFSHKSQIPNDSSDPVNLGYGYALAQKRIGETILNAATNEFINFSIENDQKMLLDTSGTLTIGHNTTQYTDSIGNERHIPLDYIKLDVNGNVRITGHTFIGGNIDVSGSNVDFNNGKLYVGNGTSFINQGRITREELPVNNTDPLVFGENQFTFSLLDYTNTITNRTQESVATFEGNIDLYGLTFVNGSHIQNNTIINNGEPLVIENTQVNTVKAAGEPTFKLIQDYDDLIRTDNDFIHCIARDFAGEVLIPGNNGLEAPSPGTDALVKAFVVDICGNTGIRTNTPVIALDISGEDAIRLPAGSNLDRPYDPKEGYIRFNNETNVFEGYRFIKKEGDTDVTPFWDTVTVLQDVDQDTRIIAQDYPGADNDQLKFFTSGDERMRIDSNGKIGIGTLQPQVPLHIYYDTTDYSFTGLDISQGIGLIIENYNETVEDADSGMLFKSKGTGECVIKFNNNNDDLWGIQSGNSHDVHSNSDNNKNFSITDLQNNEFPRFVIDKTTGNIGIGTMNPVPFAKLDIKGGNLYLDNVPENGTETDTQGAYLIFDNANGIKGPNKIQLMLPGTYGFGVNDGEVTYYSHEDHVFYYTKGTTGWIGTGTEEDAILAMELREKDLTVYGDISGNAEGKFSFSLYAGHKLNYTSYLGRAAVGYANIDNVATFSHYSQNTNIRSAIRHTSTGGLIINSSPNDSTEYLRLRTNNTDVIRIDTAQHVGITTDSTLGHFHIHETNGTVGDTNGGTLTLSHGDQGGISSVIFKNKFGDNVGNNDYGYIRYQDSYENSALGRGLLEIGSLSNQNQENRDSLVLQKEGGHVGIGTGFPKHRVHIYNDIPINTMPIEPSSVFYDDINLYADPDIVDSSLNLFHIRGALTANSINSPDLSLYGPLAKIEVDDFPSQHNHFGNFNNILCGLEVNLKPARFFTDNNKMCARFLGGRVSIGLPNAHESIEVSGNILATEALIANSDKRIKNNIKPIEDALDKIENIRGVYYNKINDSNKKHIGVIGQEIESVFPELVETYSEKDGIKDFKGVKYANLVAPLIEAIKELSKRNKLLNERISILENKFS
jgi:hypothetical protein